MEGPMKYLYGDSSASPLDYNFIQALRDTVDFAVQVLQAEQRMLVESGKAPDRRSAAEAELPKVQALARIVHRTLANSARTPTPPPTPPPPPSTINSPP